MIPFDFLICSERSGSNLITKMLDSHPDVCGPSPSHLIRASAPQLYRYGDLGQDANWEALVSDVANLLRTKIAAWKSSVTADEILQSVAGHRLSNLIRWIYGKEAKAHNKKRVFVKENHTYSFLAYLLGEFPKARFLTMIIAFIVAKNQLILR